MKTKNFPLRDILSVTTGRLLTKPKGPRDNGISNLYAVLGWITGDELFTHQLPRAGDAAKPYLLSCFPELGAATGALNRLDKYLANSKVGGHSPADAINEWLKDLRSAFPELRETYDVAPMPEGWTTIDPMIELESMVGKKKIVVVEA